MYNYERMRLNKVWNKRDCITQILDNVICVGSNMRFFKTKLLQQKLKNCPSIIGEREERSSSFRLFLYMGVSSVHSTKIEFTVK